MNRIVKILMQRDGMSRSEAEEQYKEFSDWVSETAMTSDAGLGEIEDEFMSIFNLEPDYLEDVLYDLM